MNLDKLFDVEYADAATSWRNVWIKYGLSQNFQLKIVNSED